MLSDCLLDTASDIWSYLNDPNYTDWYRKDDKHLNALIPAMLETAFAYWQTADQAKHIDTLIDLYHPEIKELAANRDAVSAYFSFRLCRDAQIKVIEYFRANDLEGMKLYVAEKRQALGMSESFSYFSSQD